MIYEQRVQRLLFIEVSPRNEYQAVVRLLGSAKRQSIEVRLVQYRGIRCGFVPIASRASSGGRGRWRP